MKTHKLLGLFLGLFVGFQLLQAQETPTVMTISQLRQSGNSESFYQINDVWVTYVGLFNGTESLIVEDVTGGLIVQGHEYAGQTYQIGDKLSSISGEYTPGSRLSSPTFYLYVDPGAPTGNEAPVPATLTLEEFQNQKARYENCLVKIENVEFYNTESEGNTFGETPKSYSIRQSEGQTDFKARNLNNTFNGLSVPASATIVGIGTSPSGTIIGLRSPQDLIVNEPEPGPGSDAVFEIRLVSGLTGQDDITPAPFQYIPETYRFQVNATGLTGDVKVSLEAGNDPDAYTYAELHTALLSESKLSETGGDTISFTLTSSKAGTLDFKILLSGGGDSAYVFSYTAPAVTKLSLGDVPNTVTAEPADMNTIYLIENMTISHAFVKKDGSTGETYSAFYAENEQGGILLSDYLHTLDFAGKSYSEGDFFPHLLGRFSRQFETGAYSFLLDCIAPEASSTGKKIEPETLDLSQTITTENLFGRLVSVNNVKINKAQGNFEAGKYYELLQISTAKAGTSASLLLLDGCDLIGQPVPSDTFRLTAISTEPQLLALGVRSSSDIVPADESGPEPVLGENLLENPGFEEWGSPSGMNPDGDIVAWTAGMGYSKETEKKIEGQYAIKISGSPINPTLYQEIGSALNPVFTAGETYRLTINYYVENGDAQGQDISLGSYWSGNASIGEMDHDAEILNNGIYFTSVGQWEKKEFTTTVPEGAVSFSFRLKMNKTATVYFDDFSLCKLSDPSTPPQIHVSPQTLNAFSAQPHAVDSQSIQISGQNLEQAVLVEFSGKDAGLFHASQNLVETSSGATSVKIYYSPEEAGSHEAVLILSSTDADTVKIPLSGKCAEIGDPAIIVNKENLLPFSAKPGQKMEQTVLISTRNLTDFVQVKREGEGMEHFLISSTFLPKDLSDYPLTITYQPKSEGEHQATIVCYSTKDNLEVRIPVSGTCSQTETTWLETFETLPEDLVYGDLYADGVKGSYHLVGAVAGNDDGQDVFTGTRSVRLGRDGAYVEMDFDLLDSIGNLSFMAAAGKQASETIKYGVFISDDFGLNWELLQDTLVSKAAGQKDIRTLTVNRNAPFRLRICKFDGGETDLLNIDSIALETLPARPIVLDSVLRLDDSEPLSLMEESFDNTRHNKPVVIDGWRNILLKGQRPWWTYQWKNTEGNEVVDYSAKATAYMSTASTTEDYEMWMVTPALNGKNTESKIFTFRVMGDLMPEKDTINTIELYYIEKDGNGYFKQAIELDMPKGKDLNGEWREFHIDLKASDVADVFFMAFRFAAPGGRENSTVYYIDDVTYGRTDLPSIESSIYSVAFEADQYAITSSDTITVKGHNLTEPISISFGGNNPSNFSSNVSSLSPEGGSFIINFLSMEVGVHTAFVCLSSKGAADLYIPISVNVLAGNPLIIVSESDLQQELTVEEGLQETVSAPIIVNGLLLTDSIYLHLEGEDAGLFALSRSSIPGNGLNESFTITFRPGNIRKATAQVRLRSQEAQDVLIDVTGINLNKTANLSDPAFEVHVWKNNTVFHVTAPDMEHIRIFSVNGREMLAQRLGGVSHVELDLNRLPSGIYILEIAARSGVKYVKVIR